LHIFNNYTDYGFHVTYCCSLGKRELYCTLSTRNQRDALVFCNKSHYSFSPRSIGLLENLNSSHQVKRFPVYYGTRKYNTACTRGHHWSPSRAISVQSMPTSWRFILKLSSHLHPGLPSVLYPTGFHTKPLYTLIH